MSGSSPLSQPPWLHPSNPTLDPPNSRARFLDGAARFGAGWSRSLERPSESYRRGFAPIRGRICLSLTAALPAGGERSPEFHLLVLPPACLPSREEEGEEGGIFGGDRGFR
jgi:hypothetical protein